MIGEGRVVAKKLKNYLMRHTEIEIKLSKNKSREFFTTDSKEKFDKLGSRFFGRKIASKKVNL